jgi:hypothetical protein
MSTTPRNRPTDVQLQSIGQLRDWLALISAVRNFNQPIDSPDGLRQAIAILAQLGETLGLDADWIDQFRAALENPAVFDIVLAIDRYLLTLFAKQSQPSLRVLADSSRDVAAQSLGIQDWLAIVTELLQLLSRLKGAK